MLITHSELFTKRRTPWIQVIVALHVFFLKSYLKWCGDVVWERLQCFIILCCNYMGLGGACRVFYHCKALLLRFIINMSSWLNWYVYIKQHA